MGQAGPSSPQRLDQAGRASGNAPTRGWRERRARGRTGLGSRSGATQPRRGPGPPGRAAEGKLGAPDRSVPAVHRTGGTVRPAGCQRAGAGALCPELPEGKTGGRGQLGWAGWPPWGGGQVRGLRAGDRGSVRAGGPCQPSATPVKGATVAEAGWPGRGQGRPWRRSRGSWGAGRRTVRRTGGGESQGLHQRGAWAWARAPEVQRGRKTGAGAGWARYACAAGPGLASRQRDRGARYGQTGNRLGTDREGQQQQKIGKQRNRNSNGCP